MLIGEKIRKVRELKGFKQETVAEHLKMSQANYSKIENGDSDLPFSRLVDIAKVLEVEPEDIISFDRKIFFNQTDSPYSSNCNVNSQVSINDLKLFEEIIKTKDKVIAALEAQIKLLER